MKRISIAFLIITLCFLSITSYAKSNTTLKSMHSAPNKVDESVMADYQLLLQKTNDPTVITTYINQHISNVTNEDAYTLIKGLVYSLKTYKQQLYQKLDRPITQKLLLTQFPNHIQKSDLKSINDSEVRQLLTQDVYNKGYTLNLIHGQYVPIINEKELEKYYLFLTPAQIQHTRITLMN